MLLNRCGGQPTAAEAKTFLVFFAEDLGFNTRVPHTPSLSLDVTGEVVHESCYQYLKEINTSSLTKQYERQPLRKPVQFLFNSIVASSLKIFPSDASLATSGKSGRRDPTSYPTVFETTSTCPPATQAPNSLPRCVCSSLPPSPHNILVFTASPCITETQ